MKTRSSYYQLIPYIRQEWKTIAQALTCTLGFTVFWPIQAALAGQIAEFIGQGNIIALAKLSGILAVVFLLQKIMQYGQDSIMAKAALSVALELRKKIYSHLLRLNLSYFETAQTGDLTYRLTEDIDRIGEVVNKIFHDFTPCVLQLIVVLGYMIYLNWQLTLATFIVAPLMGILIGWFGEQMLKFSRRSQNQISNLSSLLTEVFSGIRLVQGFAAEEYQIQRFATEAESNRQAKYATEKLKAIQNPVVGFLYAISVMLLFLLGGWQISIGNLTSAKFVSYIAGVGLLIDPIAHITSNYNDFKQGEASVDRIFELMAIQPKVLENLDAEELPQVTGKVEYRNVTFAYPGNPPQPPPSTGGAKGSESLLLSGGVPVLQNMNLLVSPGEMIALVGPSGAGKTTLANLLPRFYDPQTGQIFIDGVDIKNVTLRSLRRQIGIVPQETILFSGTIAQNIAFGQADFEMEVVEAAAKIANADQFITQFSQGYQTWVGERGVNLSGGQRQRIAIARAVLLNPRILILDEATSALDSESEALVQEALERIMKDRTVFIIAHRLATVRRADRILVLEQGQILESGTHEELLQLGDRYARFYAKQFET
ncbi:ABC transporter ATP-binding protein [Argonema galeatum]|uniref:ABC transporter ATP-binding protein n=1 Tax=Argonema galeatum TaxID=2942762 RepID=UPI0020113BA9|nr:ABC transporter ATP-binding protein [Argonema galeatum]MCL1464938.1 ABC transporter ATP-binding protein/permease [Argonema galeatum A003/A1]